MSLTRILVFVIGAVLAIVGLYLVVQNLHDVWNLVVGAILIIVGVVILSGKTFTV